MQTLNTSSTITQILYILLLSCVLLLAPNMLYGQNNDLAKGHVSAGRQMIIKKKNGNNFFGYLDQTNNDTIIPPIYASLSLFNEEGYCLGRIKLRNRYLLFDSTGTVVKDFGQNYNVIASPKGLISTSFDTINFHDIQGQELKKIVGVAQYSISKFAYQIKVVDYKLNTTYYNFDGTPCKTPDFGPQINYNDLTSYLLEKKSLPEKHEFIAAFHPNSRYGIEMSQSTNDGISYLIKHKNKAYLYSIISHRRLDICPIRWAFANGNVSTSGQYIDTDQWGLLNSELISSKLNISSDSVTLSINIKNTTYTNPKSGHTHIKIRAKRSKDGSAQIPVPTTHGIGYSDENYYLKFVDGKLGVKSIDNAVILPPLYDDISIYRSSSWDKQAIFLVSKAGKYFLVGEDQEERVLTKKDVIKQLSSVGPTILPGQDSIIVFPGHNSRQYASYFIEDGRLIPGPNQNQSPVLDEWPDAWGNIRSTQNRYNLTSMIVDFDEKRIRKKYQFIVAPIEGVKETEFLSAEGPFGYGVIDTSGKIIVNPTGLHPPKGVQFFKDGETVFAIYMKNQKRSYFNKKGRSLPPDGSHVSRTYRNKELEYVTLVHRGRYSLYDKKIKPLFDTPFSDYIPAFTGYGRMNNPEQYVQYATAGKDGLYGLLGSDGKWILPMKNAAAMEIITKDSSLVFVKEKNTDAGKILKFNTRKIIVDEVENVLTIAQLTAIEMEKQVWFTESKQILGSKQLSAIVMKDGLFSILDYSGTWSTYGPLPKGLDPIIYDYFAIEEPSD